MRALYRDVLGVLPPEGQDVGAEQVPAEAPQEPIEEPANQTQPQPSE